MKTQLLLLALLVSVTAGLAVQTPKSPGKSQQPKESKTDSATDAENNRRPKSDEDKEAKKAAEIENFILYAQSVPPEFSADLLIQVVESGKIKERRRRQNLLVEAFYTAAKAKEPLRLAALPGGVVDSRSGYRANALRFGLDSLSLQCRAIKALLPLNKQKARQLFEEIKLKLDPLNCDNSLAYDVGTFFETALAIAQTAFTPEEIQRGEHVYFVENNISRINSSNLIQPAIKVLVSLKTTNLELARLGSAFSIALAKIPTDDRSFSAPWNSTISAMEQVVLTFNQRGLPSDEILASYRSYLINQLTGQRCAEPDGGKEWKTSENDLVKHFNERLRSFAYKNIALISEDEIKPGQREGIVRDEPYWSSAKSKSILSTMRRLRFKSPGNEFTNDEKESAEWQSRLSQLMRELASWVTTDEKSEEDYFHQKCVISYALIKTIPADNKYDGLRDEALRDFATLLSNSQLQKERPAEWFLHAKILIDRANTAKSPERDKLIPLILNSRSTILHLYVQKDELLKSR